MKIKTTTILIMIFIVLFSLSHISFAENDIKLTNAQVTIVLDGPSIINLENLPFIKTNPLRLQLNEMRITYL